MEMLRLVALASEACAHVVLYGPAQFGGVEVAPESMKGALNALMTVVVHRGEDLL